MCPAQRCILNKTECIHINHLDVEDKYKWVPTCDSNGEYEAKQCKGDKATGRCFCFDHEGTRIYGWDWWQQADNMTCECSRLRRKLELKGQITTLHCTQNGNFEELQCDSEICWCADEFTGNVQNGTIAVPESMWTMLPCCMYFWFK